MMASIDVFVRNRQVKRVETREIRLPIHYDEVNAFLADYLQSIRHGSKFIPTPTPKEVGTRFVFSIDAPAIQEAFEIEARVMWIVEAENATEEKPAGIGIEFIFASESERIRCERRIQRILKYEFGDELANALFTQEHRQSQPG